MTLPEALKIAIEEEVRGRGTKALGEATRQLTHRYRDQRQTILQNQERFVIDDAQRVAYVLARMPATYGAIKYVLSELKNRYRDSINNVLDVGSGPGTSMWAVSEVFPTTQKILLLEQDSSLITLGKKLSLKCAHPLIKSAEWMQGNVLKQNHFPESDLITVSYTMGEWPSSAWSDIVEKLWTSTKKALVIVEPGTMAGFAVIRQVRQQLIDLGAFMVAPCPHTLKCPMPEDDWCHFSVRIERSRLHRQAKGGSLGYEDEKFSYVVVAKSAVELPKNRILRHPLKRSGHVSFFLCTRDDGLINRTVSRREGELYKQARDLEWGDTL